MQGLARPRQADKVRMAAAFQAAGVPFDSFVRLDLAKIVLHHKQVLATAAARACDAKGGPRWVAYGGARGGGKTGWAFIQTVVDDMQRADGIKALFLRKIGKAGRESLDDMRRRMLNRVRHTYRRHEGVIELRNGSRMLSGHFQTETDIDAYLGLEYDVVVIEEATTLTRKKLLDIKTCNRSSHEWFRPRVYLTYNPGGVGHQFVRKLGYDPWRRGRETECRYIPATVFDNPYISDEYVHDLEQLTGWQRRAWLHGDHDITVGQFFETFSVDTHVIHDRVSIGYDWPVWCGFDYGYTHWTVCHLFARSPDGAVHILDEYAARKLTVESNAAGIHAMLARNGIKPDRLRAIVGGPDLRSTDRNGKTIADDYGNYGLALTVGQIDRVQGAAEWARRLGDPSRGISPSVYINSRCHRLIDTLPYLEHDPHRPEDVRKVDADADGAGGDDAYDSARYGLMEAAGGPTAFTFPGLY